MNRLLVFMAVVGITITLQAASFKEPDNVRHPRLRPKTTAVAMLRKIATKNEQKSSTSNNHHFSRKPSKTDALLTAMDPLNNGLTDTTQASTMPLGVIRQQIKNLDSAFNAETSSHNKTDKPVDTAAALATLQAQPGKKPVIQPPVTNSTKAATH